MNWFDRFLDIVIKVFYTIALMMSVTMLIFEFIALFMMLGGK